MAEKKTRKELLKRDDAFIQAAGKSAAWVSSHRTQVTLGAVALVVVVGALWGSIEYLRARDERASRLYLDALAIRDAQVVAAEEAKPEAQPPTFASEKERDEKARAAFVKVVEEAPSSGVALLARFYVADLSTKLGDTEQALKQLSALLQNLSPDDTLYFLAVERTAYLHEQRGDTDAALATWRQLASGKDAFYADRALYQLARLHLERGEREQARALLERLEKDFADSALSGEAKALLAQLGPKEAAAGGAAEEATP